MSTDAVDLNVDVPPRVAHSRPEQVAEALRARRYPISRWYLRPLAGRLAGLLIETRVRPAHLTCCGLAMAVLAAVVMIFQPEALPVAAVLVLGYWFFDRADGQLARRQQTVSAWGAWLDANVDELADVGLHVAAAAVVARDVAASWPWLLLIAFLAGKYLLMYSLNLERANKGAESISGVQKKGPVRFLYHLPGNSDVRTHLLAAGLLSGYLAAELALVALYYNLRWIVRYALVARRLGGLP